MKNLIDHEIGKTFLKLNRASSANDELMMGQQGLNTFVKPRHGFISVYGEPPTRVVERASFGYKLSWIIPFFPTKKIISFLSLSKKFSLQIFTIFDTFSSMILGIKYPSIWIWKNSVLGQDIIHFMSTNLKR